MTMTDADLAIALLGWKLIPADGVSYKVLLSPDGKHHAIEDAPDFAHDIDATMKLVGVICDATDRNIACDITVRSTISRATDRKKYSVVFHEWPKGNVYGSHNDSFGLALRAAVVKVVVAHEPKGDTDGEA